MFRLVREYDNFFLKKLHSSLKKCGNNIYIYPTVRIIFPHMFEIGNNSSIADYTVIFAQFGVTIGDNCLISSNCTISSYNHIVNSNNRYVNQNEDFQYSKPVSISNNVWIGMNSCILPGVTIGNNSIIGAGSVVTKNVPPNEIWVGNPAKKIKDIQLGN
jgi:acetyltransferase-like isoleucine patch superfamily enzyme